MNTVKKYKVISCEVLSREVFYCAALSNNVIDISILPQRLHDMGCMKMQELIQQEIDSTNSENYDAIILCYGLCSNGIIGLKSNLPLIVPKAHDCITLLLGSRDAYNYHFRDNPGTFYKSSGWLERDVNSNGIANDIFKNSGINTEFEDEYDEETVAFLLEALGGMMQHYSKITYIDTGVGNKEHLTNLAKEQAYHNNLQFEVVSGNLDLLLNLFNGNWNDNYLVVPPGNYIINSYDDNIIKYGKQQIPITNK